MIQSNNRHFLIVVELTSNDSNVKTHILKPIHHKSESKITIVNFLYVLKLKHFDTQL